MTRIDPTRTIELLARRLRLRGAAHPVAGAVAQAARGASCLAVAEFSEEMNLTVDLVTRAERGCVSFGLLPSQIGLAAAGTGADLFALAGLVREWCCSAESAASDG